MAPGLYGLVLALILVMRLAPQSSTGRLLRAALVERPLEELSRLERHHLIFVVVLATMMLAAGEAIALAGSAELLAAYALDVAIYLDAVVATYALAAVGRVRARPRSVAMLASGVLRRARPAARRRRQRTGCGRKVQANDDDPAPARLAA